MKTEACIESVTDNRDIIGCKRLGSARKVRSFKTDLSEDRSFAAWKPFYKTGLTGLLHMLPTRKDTSSCLDGIYIFL